MSGGEFHSTDNRPDPAEAVDLADYVGRLDQLRVQTPGEPSLRVLARRVGPLMRPPREVAHSTIAAVFHPDRRRLDLDLVVAIVRVLTGDEAVVDAWRQAYLRIQRDVKTGGAAGVFRQLPADLATFTGRETMLKQLIDAATAPAGGGLANTVVVSAIEGMGGIGKTQLAVHAAHELVRAGRYGDVQLFVNLRGFDPEHPPVDPSAVLEAFLRQLGVMQIPGSLDERAVMFRDRLAGKDALIVLDNAADEQQVRDLIPADPSCLVLITSRRGMADLDGALLCRLDVLSPEESITLLARIVGAERVEAERSVAEWIARACGHVPLAISLVAARLRSRPAWNLADMAARLERGLDEFASGGRALTAVFELSYRGLPEAVQRLFRLCGWHPGADFTAASIAAAAGQGVVETEGMLERLLDEHLLQQRTADRYELHDLLRVYARELAELEPLALARVATWYLLTAQDASHLLNPPTSSPVAVEETHGVVSLALADYDEALAWFDAEDADLLAVVKTAAEHGLDALVWRLAASYHNVAVIKARMPQYGRLCTLGLAAAQRIGDALGQVRMLNGLAVVAHEDQRHEDAVGHHLRAIEICRPDPTPEMQWRRIIALLNASRSYSALQQYDEALAALEEVLTSCPEERRALAESHALHNIGALHAIRGDHAEAIRTFHRAITLHRQERNGLSEMSGWHQIGRSSLEIGDPDTALDAFEKLLNLSVELDSALFQGLARMRIGDVMATTDRIDEARECWKAAESILAALGHPDVDMPRRRLATGQIDPFTADG